MAPHSPRFKPCAMRRIPMLYCDRLMASSYVWSPFFFIFDDSAMSLSIRILLFLSILPLAPLLAQTAVVKGKVMDGKTGDPLPFASIQVNRQNTTAADSNGFYRFQTEPGKVVVSVKQLGYAPFEQTIRVGFEEQITVNLELTPQQNELDRVVVSGSRQEIKITREVMSVTSVQPYLIANTNANTLSDVLNKVPGVSIIDGQAMIRGGTGWSYNVGSRVMVLLDDMPLMGPDLGDVQWDLLPIEAAENVEVIKGPSSVLYGSSASAGTVNVRTGWPTNKPQTRITFFQGVVDNPRNKNSIWWERTTQPFNTGSFVEHRQKFGQFDVVASANLNANRSHIQDNDEFRARTYFKTRYRFKEVKGLSAGLNGTYMAKKAGRFFIWKDADTGALIPFDGSIGYDKYFIYSIDPHITYLQPSYSLSLKYRFYNITRDGLFGAQKLQRTNDAVAKMHAVDMNFQKKFMHYFTSTSGIYVTGFNAIGNVYPGKQTGSSGAAYTQLEFLRKRWHITTGLRYEMNAVGAVEETQRPLFRAGINYQAREKTFIRASYGEGFRFPTAVERYIEDEIGGISLYPNPDLQSERGWYTELGVKQGFTISGFNATVDACLFWMEYENLIQLRFDQYERASYYIDTVNFQVVIVGQDKIGFKAINLPKSRTAGFEVSLEGGGNIGQVGIRTLCGYTYSYPVDLSADSTLKQVGNYVNAMFDYYKFIDAQSPAFNSLVAYRTRHLVKSDVELSYKKVSVGYSLNYTSIYEKIDDALYHAVPGLKNFQDDAGTGYWVHNARLGFRLTHQFTLAFLVSNLTNLTYASRPARMDAMRTFSLQMRITL